MRPLGKVRTRTEARRRRHIRLRRKVRGTAERPRLAVYRSLRHIYAQLVDDDKGTTLLAMSDRTRGVKADGEGKVGIARGVGKLLAEKARLIGVQKVVFDRGGYPYHGRVRAVAEGARKGGLEF